MRRSSKSWQMGMMRSRDSDQITITRSSLYVTSKGWWKSIRENKTYDEGRALLFIRLRKHEHRLQDLDAGLSIDVDALLVCRAVC